MTGRTHDMIAVSGGSIAAVASGLSFVPATALVASTFLTSRLPDQAEGEWAEHRGPTHRLYAPLVMGGLVLVISTLALNYLRKHFLLQTSVLNAHQINHYANIAAQYFRIVAAGVVLGAALHLLADACTITGVPWRKRRLHLLPHGARFRTGGNAERVLQAVIILAILCLAYSEVHHLVVHAVHAMRGRT
jgi:membrane-bound metal-dependent hydrolase YbcI (DUF457 family)